MNQIQSEVKVNYLTSKEECCDCVTTLRFRQSPLKKSPIDIVPGHQSSFGEFRGGWNFGKGVRVWNNGIVGDDFLVIDDVVVVGGIVVRGFQFFGGIWGTL